MNCLRFNPRKRSQLFFITVPHTNISKLHVFQSLEDLCLRLVVSQERHSDGSYHHHIFMKGNHKFQVQEIEDMIRNIYDIDVGHRTSDLFQVATVRNQKNALKYISKEDTAPLFKGVLASELTFAYRATTWARNTPNFAYSDPFVLQHPQYYRLLKEVHTSVHGRDMRQEKRPLRKYEIAENEDLSDWERQVVAFWNDWVEHGHSPKKPQLYLWGPSNTGKTTFITKLLTRCINLPGDDDFYYEGQVLTPTPNEKRFAYEAYEPYQHNVVVVDEFDIEEYNLNDFKRFVAGEPFVVNRKNQPSVRMKARMPMIFISNHPPPTAQTGHAYEGVMNRLLVVNTGPAPTPETQVPAPPVPMDIVEY